MIFKREKPCEAYSGNLCTGFGGKSECLICGWARWAHNADKYEAFDKLARAKGEDLEK